MFERYTEKARRVIFFARYEASQYGAAFIETQHLLLGLMREDPLLVRRFLGPSKIATDIRAEIDNLVTRGQRVSTSIEMPLDNECKKALNLAAEESERLGHRNIGTEHFLLALLGVEGSPAARLLHERGVKPEIIREQLANSPGGPVTVSVRATPNQNAITTLDSFLAASKLSDWDQLAPFFAQSCQFIDAMGKRWKGRDEIKKQFAGLFAPYATKKVTFLLESTDSGPAHSLVANVLWENVSLGHESKRSLHRLTIALAPEDSEWAIFLIQVTPVVIP
jgi:ketosteroid isomerase-like protein